MNNNLKLKIMNKNKKKINLRKYSTNTNYTLFYDINTKRIFLKNIFSKCFITKLLFIICFISSKYIASLRINGILYSQNKIMIKINKPGHHKIFNKITGKDICEYGNDIPTNYT